MAPLWEIKRKGAMLQGVGEQALLKAPLTAFFASRQCPGSAIRAAMGWAIGQANARQTIIGGFHSPLEQSVLQVLLQASCPAVAVLARPVSKAKIPSGWETAILEGRLAIVSASTQTKRLTSQEALQRNELTAHLADAIVIAHANAGGTLAQQAMSWEGRGFRVMNISPDHTAKV